MSSGAPLKPLVIILSLENTGKFQDTYAYLYMRLCEDMECHDIVSSAAALEYLSKPSRRPKLVLIADIGLCFHEEETLRQAVISYVRSGGTVVALAGFADQECGPLASWLFRALGLPWQMGTAFSAVVNLNSHAEPTLEWIQHLVSGYWQNAVWIRNVEREHAVYYEVGIEYDIKQHDANVQDTEPKWLPETPVAIAPVGEGWFAYVGDQGGSPGSALVVKGFLTPNLELARRWLQITSQSSFEQSP